MIEDGVAFGGNGITRSGREIAAVTAYYGTITAW